VQLKRIGISVFLLFSLTSLCSKSLICFDQEKKPPIKIKDVASMEKDLFKLVNLARQEHDLAPVIFSTPLSFLARKHSQDMASRDGTEISHFSTSGQGYSERLVAEGFFFKKSGENVAFSETFVAEFIHQELMDSPGHKANILDPDFDEVGIGVFFKEDKGYYVTQDFAKSLKPKGREEARAEVEEHINSMRLEYSLPPILFSKEAGGYAQQCSLNKAKDKPIPPFPSHFGETHLIYIKSPSFEYLYSRQKVKLLDRIYQTAGLGIYFSRHEENPGGTYFITLLLFPENKYKSRSKKDLKEIVLRTINITRENKGLLLFTEDKRLATNAKKALRMIYAQKNTSSITIPKFVGAAVISYVSEDPTLLPKGLKSQLEENFVYYKRIGIDILFGKDSKYPRGAFWVVALIME
jgi:uncharacterized protein YkwD